MSRSHFLGKLESLVKKGLDGVEEAIDKLDPLRTLSCYKKESDTLYNKFERLPPQAHFSQEKADAIYAALRRGLDEAAAAKRARVPVEIVQKWIILGEKGVEPFQTFWLEFEGCIADHEFETLNGHAQADPVDYSKHMTKNSRTLQAKYNRANQQIVMVNAAPVMPSLTKEQSRAKMAELAGQGITVHPPRL